MSQWLPAQEGDAGFTSHQTPLFTFGSFTDEEARQLQYGSQAPPIPATGHQNFLSNSHDSTGFTTNHHPRSQHEEIPHDGRSSGVVLDVNIDEGQRRLKKAAEEAEKGDARRELSEILDHIDLNLYRDGGGEKGVEDKKGIKPPGLMNHGNTCYLSATIQCLLNLPVFKKLLSEVREVREAEAREGFAVLHALCALEETMLVGDGGAIDVTPLLGTLMRERKDFQRLFPRGSQQDAQEFAQWLLDVLSDEHLAHLAQQSGGDNGNSDDDGGWQEAGKGGKGAVKLNHVGQGKKTYISRIFGGAMRTSVKVPGVKSSVTVQPFSSLHIDVQSRDEQDGIEAMMSPEVVPELGTAREARKGGSVTCSFDALPAVLILHLKRFAYRASDGTTQKLSKMVKYPLELEVKERHLTGKYKKSVEVALSANEVEEKDIKERAKMCRTYTLCGIVNHHGKTSSSGHYTNMIMVSQDTQKKSIWFKCDDTKVSSAKLPEVLRSDGCYLLFYTRNIPHSHG